MNLKKYLIEQAESQKFALLENAISSGCIAKYSDFEMDNVPQPQRIKIGDAAVTEWAITGKSKKSGNIIYFLSGFGDKKQVIINVTEAQKPENERDPKKMIKFWVCEQAESGSNSPTTPSNDQREYLKRLESLGWTTKKPTEMDLDNGTYLSFNLQTGKKHKDQNITDKEIVYSDVKNYVNYFKDTPVIVYKINPKQKGYQEVDRGDCRETIDKLYDLYEKGEGDDLLLKELVKKAQSCVNQKSFQINPFLKKKIQVLSNLNVMNPQLAKYKIAQLQRESISKKVKQTLIETKEKKNNLLIERELVESRLKSIVPSLTKYKRLSESNKIKVGFRLLQEVSYIKNIGLVQEELGQTMKKIFGKSLEDVVGNISEPFLNSIVNKLGLSNELQVQIIDSLKEKNQELLNHMDDCKDLSRFISENMIETITNNMKEGEILGSELLDRTLLSSMKEEMFKIKLGAEIEKLVCEAFNKFTDNAKNLVTKLTGE